MDLIRPAKLFYPSTVPTRRRRRRVPWAGVAAVIAAMMAGWMIREVHLLHQQRRETQLRERHVPASRPRPIRPTESSKPEPARLIRLQETVTASSRMLTARQ
jgi:hypothetical protein